MHVLTVRNVNTAYVQGLEYFTAHGREYPSRAGAVIALDAPLTLVYEKPCERVLLHPERNANPFFHLYEALWMLAGRNDARALDAFVHDFSSRFAEEGGIQHGAYGYRWRNHFEMEGGGHPLLPDQLTMIIQQLRSDPMDRRVVLQMWDPVADLGAMKKDVPCNTNAYFRARLDKTGQLVLDLTVCCRSNDFIWGMTGANAVHFSVLLEYVAGKVGLPVGRYYQIANNPHIYLERFPKHEHVGKDPYAEDMHIHSVSMGASHQAFDEALCRFLSDFDSGKPFPKYDVLWFDNVVVPVFTAYRMFKAKEVGVSSAFLKLASCGDWGQAAMMWLHRHLTRKAAKQ